MELDLIEITIRDLAKNYEDNGEIGVIGYDGLLDIRPPFQREFVYNDKQREAVIDTVRKGFPLNVMYWAVRTDDKIPYEIIDGQQRTISVCQYVIGDFSFKNLYFHNLQDDEKEQILNYKMSIYICDGTPSEKLEWFRTINIAGAVLTDQELRNAVYHGPWVTDSKRYFSKTGCVAYQIGGKYLKGTPIRQDYLESVIKWISNDNIDDYMAKNQHHEKANELWEYFVNVIEWIEKIFIDYRKEMIGIDWGFLYNKYKNKDINSNKMKLKVDTLMQDDDVQNGRGIYYYVFDGKEKHLNIRTFNDREKRITYEQQKGICPNCKNNFDFNEMHGDHITPWHLGGKTIQENCQMLCADCNRRKSGI